MRNGVRALTVAAVCWIFGGWHFAAVAAVAMALLRFENVWPASAVSLLWLGLFFASGDARLFFPFSIQYALQLAFPRSAAVAGAFLFIRIVQGATLKVLSVEFAVAAAVLAICSGAYARSSKSLQARIGWAALGSFLAYVGLAF